MDENLYSINDIFVVLLTLSNLRIHIFYIGILNESFPTLLIMGQTLSVSKSWFLS